MSEKESIKQISVAMFLKNIHECGLPDVHAVEGNYLTRRLKYKQTLQKDLKI